MIFRYERQSTGFEKVATQIFTLSRHVILVVLIDRVTHLSLVVPDLDVQHLEVPAFIQWYVHKIAVLCSEGFVGRPPIGSDIGSLVYVVGED